MLPVQDNEATRLMKEKLLGYDFEKEELPGKEDMENFRFVSNFIEYVHKYAQKSGYCNEVFDASKLVKFVLKKCKEAGVSISHQTLTNWVTTAPPSGEKARENVYRLCFALQMDAVQTHEFFLKAFLERPFNYKDIHEAVYFFCLNNSLKYADAQRIIGQIEMTEIIEDPKANYDTKVIGERLSEMQSEKELIQYLIKNRSGFVDQNQSAINKIKSLLKNCKKNAPKECAISFLYVHEYESNIKVNSTDQLLNVIYGYDAREVIVKKDDRDTVIKNEKGNLIKESIYKKTITYSNFPELIKHNWPQSKQFSDILNRKAKYDAIRRALIILTFYDFMANALIHKEELHIKDNHIWEYNLFDEFVNEMNGVLDQCGYAQLYWRNPFDWIIGYCAKSLNPLGTLRDLIDEYYLSDPEVIDS